MCWKIRSCFVFPDVGMYHTIEHLHTGTFAAETCTKFLRGNFWREGLIASGGKGLSASWSIHDVLYQKRLPSLSSLWERWELLALWIVNAVPSLWNTPFLQANETRWQPEDHSGPNPVTAAAMEIVKTMMTNKRTWEDDSNPQAEKKQKDPWKMIGKLWQTDADDVSYLNRHRGFGCMFL